MHSFILNTHPINRLSKAGAALVNTISSLWFFKDYKPKVPSHNSFESQLCGTLKNPHAIRKEKARSSRCCGLSFTQVKNVKVFFLSFKKGNGNSEGLIRLSNNLHRRRCTNTKQIMST